MSTKVVKKRNWTFVLYPESAPADWLERLQKTGLQCEISPLHDKDTNPDGTPKKAHYHVIVCYSGPTSYTVVKALTDSLRQPIPQALEQVKGMHRYFTHQDNPEKYQYDPKEIRTLNGFNILDYSDPTRSEVLEYKKELFALIRSQRMTEYSALIDFLMDNEMSDLLDCAASNTVLFTNYIRSRRYALSIEAVESENEKLRQEVQDMQNLLDALRKRPR